MDNPVRYSLPKQHRLCSRKALDALFGGEGRWVSAFPIRAIYAPTSEEGVRIMVSVSKRFFKRAVMRNRIKRQMREAYRLHQHLLVPHAGGLNIAFLWNAAETLPSAKVSSKIENLLHRIHEAVNPSRPSV